MATVTAPEIRKEILALRRALDPQECLRRSEPLVATLLRGLSGHGLKKLSVLRVALYRSMPGEVRTDGLHEAFLSGGGRCFFPRLNDRATGSMDLVEVPLGAPGGAPAPWVLGPYRIWEPAPHLPQGDPAELDLVIVPGVAFGPRGERLGMGGGYYDRFLAKAPQALRVALAFDFQIREGLPQEPWDQPVDWVISESREIVAAGRQKG